jgi:hypothetical protein
MFSAMRRHFSFAGLIATLALVLAMSGGAWAAKKYLITSTNQISPSVLKKLKGATGPQGLPGTPGSPGAKGDAGAPGTNGTNGLSVTMTKLNPGDLNCKEGGAKFAVGAGTPTFACNGSPWAAGGTLPSEATETGMWSFGVNPPERQYVSVGFAVPLETPIEAANVHYIKTEGEDAVDCPGSLTEPAAAPEQLCLYKKFGNNIEDLTPALLTTGGATIIAEPTLEAITEGFLIFGLGSWAVTAG